MDRGRVEVDPEIGALDDLGVENIGQLRRQRSARRSGKAAIEITAVGQIAAVADEPVDVDYRHAKQGARQLAGRNALEQAANDFDTGDFVPVYRRADEQCRARFLAMHDPHRHRRRLSRRQAADRQVERPLRARRDALPAEQEVSLGRRGSRILWHRHIMPLSGGAPICAR